MELQSLTSKEYKKVFETFYTPLCLFANKYLDDIELSEDIVQEVFIKIWEEEVKFKRGADVKPFLYTIVKNKTLDYLKTRYATSTQPLQAEDFADMDSDPFFIREVIISETAVHIENAVSTLPAKCKQIIMLSLKGMSNPEIAQQLDLSLNTVKAQKKIAYKKLKPLLKEHFSFITFIF